MSTSADIPLRLSHIAGRSWPGNGGEAAAASPAQGLLVVPVLNLVDHFLQHDCRGVFAVVAVFAAFGCIFHGLGAGDRCRSDVLQPDRVGNGLQPRDGEPCPFMVAARGWPDPCPLVLGAEEAGLDIGGVLRQVHEAGLQRALCGDVPPIPRRL